MIYYAIVITSFAQNAAQYSLPWMDLACAQCAYIHPKFYVILVIFNTILGR